MGGGCVDSAEVMSGGSLGGVGEDWATGLPLFSDEWGKWKQGEAIFLLGYGQRRLQLGPDGGEYREARAGWGSCDGE